MPREYVSRRLNRYDLKKKTRMRSERLADLTSGFSPSGAFPVDKFGRYTSNKEEIEYYKRYWRGSRSKYLKRQSNKKLRRYKHEVPSRGGYRKVFDFWWELW